ncbi:uncharacterized protein BN788_01525 [[Eubacterium] siraeum CAG:80]|uniref:Uncharacterized protein n=1 Tax=[Eubacterium] siraeum CAG:80 TaxID=1263080 RepID=R6R9T4_9FIRM|nr:uncharacterized protein BN788_01525 [[Eubacterium] siraeum CAG:80]
MGTSNILLYRHFHIGDHPHACGEKLFFAFQLIFLRGSSPRVWGQVTTPPAAFAEGRIIPTRVGTRWCTAKQRAAGRDHPHACGDKLFVILLFEITQGSSPRVWGQDDIYFSGSHSDRIIPTRVGTRTSKRQFLTVKRDHPHACGDKTWTANTIFGIVGSSPRVWGQVYYQYPHI